jgi:hypothetical protein
MQIQGVGHLSLEGIQLFILIYIIFEETKAWIPTVQVLVVQNFIGALLCYARACKKVTTLLVLGTLA